jgi:hypothetical protein
LWGQGGCGGLSCPAYSGGPVFPGLADYRDGFQDRHIVAVPPEQFEYRAGFPRGDLEGGLIGFYFTDHRIRAY